MRIHTHIDESRSRLDLVAAAASCLLMVGFGCAVVVLLLH
jgi:hypothetical protein